MIAVTYRIELLEPLLATSLEGDPNSAVSFDYIPGSLIRGVIAGQVVQDDVDLAIEERSILFSADVRYLNAYPACGDEEARRLPVPNSWKVEKEQAGQDGADVWDFAHLSKDERSKKGQVKDLGGFTLGRNGDCSRYRPLRQIAVHTLRDRHAGRATQALGAVYRYDALAQGERFRGVVLANSATQAAEIEKLLSPGIYYLGGVQGGGYGKVRISEVQVNQTWEEIPAAPQTVKAGAELRITLLSDAILRTSWGSTTVDIRCALPWNVKMADSYRQITYVGGFNRKWGLPLPQEQALRAGSVFVLNAEEEIAADQLQKLVDEGIGERRAEGFGRLAVNWGDKSQFVSPKARPAQEVKDSEEQEPSDKLTINSKDGITMAQRMEKRLHRRHLDRELLRAIEECKVSGAISNSQLARLRIIARSALAEAKAAQKQNLQRLASLFDSQNPKALRPTALKKYSRVRVNNQRLTEWISDYARKPALVWSDLTPKLSNEEMKGLLDTKTPIFDPQKPKLLVPTDAEGTGPDGMLALEYTVRLIDGVLEKKMKENR